MSSKKQVLLMMNARKFLGVIVQYAAQHNWRFTLMNDGIAPRGWKGDGALVSFSRSEVQMNFIADLAKGTIPVVGLSYARPDIKIPRALVDFAQNANLAAEYLYSKGYRQFAFCTGERIKSTEIAYEAFVAALRSKGVLGKIPWVVRSEMIRKGQEEDWDENIRAFNLLFNLPSPLGIWCMSDSVAAHVLESALASGKDVPGEVGVLGTNDNVIVCENQDVAISSINPDFRTLALTACEMLDRMMDGKSLEDEFEHIPALGVSERESTIGAFGKNSHLKSILQYLSDNSAEAVSVKDVAGRFNMSESALHRLFRDELKSTPLSELRALRLQKAKSLLRTTDFTLDYIAKATGFLHASHLVNAFRSAVGLTPAEWRRQWM